jgi:hypothetical protein
MTSQVNFMRKRGIVLGSRWKDGRQIYIYMFRDLFAEVIYKNDNPKDEAESIEFISGLEKLNQHLENQIKVN